MNRLIPFFIVFLLVGCSPSGNTTQAIPLNMTVPDNLSIDAKYLAERSIPRIKNACPGLNKYGGALIYKGIEDSLKYGNKITFLFLVPDVKSSVPSEYKALGHNCFIDVDATGAKLSIAKRPCKAVCLDQNVYGTANDNGNDLVIYLAK